MSYQNASRCFVNRDFAGSIELLGHTLPADLKSWTLYMALCERALVEPFTPAWSEENKDRIKLRRAILKGHVWPQMKHSWQMQETIEVGGGMPPLILLKAAMILSAKHRADPAPAIKFIEEFISICSETGTHNIDIIDLFITSILCDLSNDFMYARELALSTHNSRTTEQQQQLLSSIEHREKLLAQERQKAIEEHNAKIELAKEREREIALAREKSTHEEEEIANNTAKYENSHITGELSSRKHHSHNLHPHETLVDYWKRWAHGIIRGQGVYNGLAAILFICALLSNRRCKQGLREGILAFYRAARTGAAMALRVTYL